MGEGRGDPNDAERAGSDTLVGRVGTVGSLRRVSKRKKPRRFAGTRGEIGVATAVGDVDEIADMGRFRVNKSPPKCGFFCGDTSRIAPAVLGRFVGSTDVLIEGRLIRGGVDAPALTIEERLPVAE
jgi:hypothetical protein